MRRVDEDLIPRAFNTSTSNEPAGALVAGRCVVVIVYVVSRVKPTGDDDDGRRWGVKMIENEFEKRI